MGRVQSTRPPPRYLLPIYLQYPTFLIISTASGHGGLPACATFKEYSDFFIIPNFIEVCNYETAEMDVLTIILTVKPECTVTEVI